MKQKLIYLKGEIDKPSIIIGVQQASSQQPIEQVDRKSIRIEKT